MKVGDMALDVTAKTMTYKMIVSNIYLTGKLFKNLMLFFASALSSFWPAPCFFLYSFLFVWISPNYILPKMNGDYLYGINLYSINKSKLILSVYQIQICS